jgi:metal-responsive CopG/Arc/MetJ family transcriptional regulator
VKTAVSVKDFLEKFRVQHPKDDEEIAVAVWTVKDVKIRAEERQIKISDEDAQKIVAALHRHHDPNIGITWETIDEYLNGLEIP